MRLAVRPHSRHNEEYIFFPFTGNFIHISTYQPYFRALPRYER